MTTTVLLTSSLTSSCVASDSTITSNLIVTFIVFISVPFWILISEFSILPFVLRTQRMLYLAVVGEMLVPWTLEPAQELAMSPDNPYDSVLEP